MSETSRPVKPKITYGELLGKIIDYRRKQLGLLQAPFAEALGITQSGYSRLEKGQSAMSVVQLQIVARLLRCTPANLLADADRYAVQLRAQGAEIVTDKQNSSAAGLLIALGILAALLASKK